MNHKSLLCAVLAIVPALPGCAAFRPQVAQSIDDDWSSPLDRDLQIAADRSDAYFAENGWKIQLRWAGVQGASYTVERGPNGEPIRQAVSLTYVFYHPALKKCFFSPGASPPYDVRLVREHLGGGRYGEPQIFGMEPVKGDDSEPIGQEVVCSAVDKAKGGVRVHVDGASASGTVARSPTTAPGKSAVVASATDPVTRLVPELPTACADYVRAACTRADLPSGTDRNHFCSDLVDNMNTRGVKPGADKKCRTMLKHQAR